MILYMLSNKVIFLIWLFCALCFEVRFFCRKNERRRGHELSLKSWKQSSDEATPLGPEYAPQQLSLMPGLWALMPLDLSL